MFVDNLETRLTVNSGTSHEGSRPSDNGYGRPHVESLCWTCAGSVAAVAQPVHAQHMVPLPEMLLVILSSDTEL